MGLFSIVMATLKIAGIALFGIAALWTSGFQFAAASESAQTYTATGFIASTALAILAFKGFTTITNSGGELTDPHRNVGRAIMISIALCVVIYLLVAFGVGSSLTIDQIVAARDYSLAAAAEPALGKTGFYLTIILAAIATASGVLASVFAVSRMLAMLTDMKMIPHSHFGMSGPIQRHTLVYTVVMASTLAVFFDLGQIASLGAFFYLIMDMMVHWGVFRYRRKEIGASAVLLLMALSFDAVVLVAFTAMKLESDPAIVVYALIGIVAVFGFERWYLSRWVAPEAD
ncbi:Amino acid permease [Oxalobacteraceae bacterium IMCC9480]|nr:Amino acid permease [Oxalobacteraceae bacterium IMCC9480]